jgi:hypothetical protein
MAELLLSKGGPKYVSGDGTGSVSWKKQKQQQQQKKKQPQQQQGKGQQQKRKGGAQVGSRFSITLRSVNHYLPCLVRYQTLII